MICLNDNMLLSMLDNDCPYGDITTNGLGLSKVNAEITMTARTDMTLCGVEEAARLFHLKHNKITQFFKSGDTLNAGDVILIGKGCPWLIL